MRIFLLIAAFALCTSNIYSQDEDLLALVEEDDDEKEREFASALWKTTRVINLHSLENNAPGELDFKISHRFGFINQGAYEFFGLDNATIRLGLEMGLTDRLMVGVGRSSFQKTYDGFLKYKLIKQARGPGSPIAVSGFASINVNTLRPDDPDEEVLFSSRLSYAFQLIIGRKFSESFTAQVSPTLIHRNLVETTDEANDVFAFAFAARQKIGKRFAINAEYIYVLPDQISEEFVNYSLSVGVDIETGGHVFQLHLTNSTAMTEPGFVAENTGDFFDGDIHFGFNISRVFTLWDPYGKKAPKKEW